MEMLNKMENLEKINEEESVETLTDSGIPNEDDKKKIMSTMRPGPESCRLWWDW